MKIPVFPLQSELKLTNILKSSMPNIKYYTKCSIVFNATKHTVNNTIIYLLDTQFSQYNLLIGLDILLGLKIDVQKHPVITLNNVLLKQDVNDTITLSNIENIEFRDHDIFARETKIIYPKQQTTVKTINKTQQDEIIFLEVPESLNDIIAISQKYIPKRGFLTIQNMTDKLILIRKNILLTQQMKTYITNNIMCVSELDDRDRKNIQIQYKNWVKNRQTIIRENDFSIEIKQYCNKLPMLNKEMEILLNEYNEIFARTSEDIGYNRHFIADLIIKEGHIDNIKRIPQYKIPFELSEQINIKLKNMEKLHIIEKTFSPFNTPIIYLPKTNGTLRMVANFKNLNENLKVTQFPIQNISELFYNLSHQINNLKRQKKKICIISIDAKNAYFWIQIKENKQLYTAFTHANQQYKFRVLPQGLNISPFIFTKVILLELEKFDTTFGKPFLYLDDILFITSEEVALQCMMEILKWIKEANLVIGIDKLQIFRKSIKFLGYIITENGLETDREKLTVIENLKNPETLTAAQRFCGLLAYYTPIINKIQYILSPIYRDISKKGKFTLSYTSQIACNKVRQLAKDTHKIAHFDPKQDIYLYTDSPLTGLGAFIGNCKINEIDKTIRNVSITSFYSKPWDIQFSLLSSRARELGAIAAALEYFNLYLLQSILLYIVLLIINH